METQDYRIPEVMRRLMSEDKRLNKSVNGDQSQPHHQQLHHQSHSMHPQAQGQSQSQQNQRLNTNDDFNPNIEEDASDSGQGRAILKIPSYKPASTPGCSSKNGEPTSAAFAQGFAAAAAAAASASSPGLLERASPAFSGTSSPTNSLVGKTVVNFRDVIDREEHQRQVPGGATGLRGGHAWLPARGDGAVAAEHGDGPQPVQAGPVHAASAGVAASAGAGEVAGPRRGQAETGDGRQGDETEAREIQELR